MTAELNDLNHESFAGKTRKGQRIAVVASFTRSLTIFRFELLKSMVGAGHEVIAFAPEDDEEVQRALASIGVRFVRIPMARTGLNPLADLRTLLVLWGHFRRLKPDTILPYTMKPIIYGGLAARLAGVPHRFALVTGLGHVFADAKPSRRMALLRHVAIQLYRLALAGTELVFVYNQADADEICRRRMVRSRADLELVPGTGADLDHFLRSNPPLKPVTFLMIARLLREKGVVEFVEAARQLRRRRPEVRVQLLGPLDSNPSGLSQADIDAWSEEGVVEYLGETRDVRPFLAGCTVFVLPSYREGMPRAVLEAMATGRAVITTDAPGCRDTVLEGQNGFIVPPRDHARLAEAMESFALEPELAIRMGQRSYELARERYDVHAINRQLLSAMALR